MHQAVVAIAPVAEIVKVVLANTEAAETKADVGPEVEEEAVAGAKVAAAAVGINKRSAVTPVTVPGRAAEAEIGSTILEVAKDMEAVDTAEAAAVVIGITMDSTLKDKIGAVRYSYLDLSMK